MSWLRYDLSVCQQCVTSTCGHVDSLLQKWQQEEPVAQKGTRGQPFNIQEWCAKMGIFFFRKNVLSMSFQNEPIYQQIHIPSGKLT